MCILTVCDSQELKNQIAKTVTHYLEHFYRHKHFDSKDSYKFLAKKLTERVYNKRLALRKMYLSDNTKKDIKHMVEKIFRPRKGATSRYVFSVHTYNEADIQ